MRVLTVVAVGLAVLVGCLECRASVAQSHFQNRMTSITEVLDKMPDETTATILLLGDSITEGFFTSGIQPEKIAGLPVINQGIGGDNIGTSTSNVGVRSRLDTVAKAKPAVVFMMIGVNNMWNKDETADQLIRDYEELVPALKAAVPQAKVVLQSVLPCGPTREYVNPKALQLNKRIKELAAENQMEYLDLHPIMADATGRLKPEYTYDDVHLTKEAYKAWLKVITETASRLTASN